MTRPLSTAAQAVLAAPTRAAALRELAGRMDAPFSVVLPRIADALEEAP